MLDPVACHSFKDAGGIHNTPRSEITEFIIHDNSYSQVSPLVPVHRAQVLTGLHKVGQMITAHTVKCTRGEELCV